MMKRNRSNRSGSPLLAVLEFFVVVVVVGRGRRGGKKEEKETNARSNTASLVLEVS